MALHPEFPSSPYEPLLPGHRWFPADEARREIAYEKLLPPLVAKIRLEVQDWRASGYSGASPTTQALLNHWFETEHLLENADGTHSPFRYYYAQREAVESAIWLYEVRQARDKYDLLRFDASGSVSHGMFPEEWPRYVLKLATGAGKTKVLSLLIAWSWFHRFYEEGSTLAHNFLLIAPNIIVLDRLRADFDGLKIFFNDPILPENGHQGRNWRDDFQLTVHLQDEVRVLRPSGNLFLTNIHRVFLNDVPDPSLEDDDLRDYFLNDAFGPTPVGRTNDSKTDLGEIIREIDDLAVFNDEAHHIHDSRMAWFKSIEDIHHRMILREKHLALQIDVTATPKHTNGSIFVQTISDYPLVEAIHQNVVKHPILPDAASRDRLRERKSVMFPEKYADYLQLGVEEWRKSSAEHARLGKKAVLFVMVDDTKNCDDVGAHLQKICPELEGKVLVIHTKNNGEISEASSGKNKEELELLRKQSNEIDSLDSPYHAIVSVLMLKEGWDVRNVTVICGLRAYVAKANILPEQTLGRGLRRMYFGSDLRETVSVLGTPAFMEFVEEIQSEGVTFDQVPMGGDAERQDSLIVEIDGENPEKNLTALDIPLPRLTRRYHREFTHLEDLDPATLGGHRLPLKSFPAGEEREIVFKTMLDGEIDHIVSLEADGGGDWRSIVAFFARQLLKELRLVGGYEFLYPAVRDYVRSHLFVGEPLDLDDPNVWRNLSEPAAGKLLFDTFKKAINDLTVRETTVSRVEDRHSLLATRPFRTAPRDFVAARKSVFNRIVGEVQGGGLELAFARFLEQASDVAAFAKNYLAVGFRLDYVKADGDLSTYTPDFLVRDLAGKVWIVETKGREEIDIPQKMARLKQWCEDAAAAESEEGGNDTLFDFIYVDQDSFEKHAPKSLADLTASFTEYKKP